MPQSGIDAPARADYARSVQYRHSCGESYEVPDELKGTKAECPACGRVFDVPPFDIAKPLENAGLRDAIERVYRNAGQAQELKTALQGMMRSYFLVPALVRPSPGTKPLPADSRVQVWSLPAGVESGFVAGKDGLNRSYLAVFADWREVMAFRGDAPDEPGWTGVVLAWPAIEALMGQNEAYVAVMVNPGSGRALHIPRDVLALLRSDLDAAVARLEAAASELPPRPPEPEAGAQQYRHGCGADLVIEPAEAGTILTCRGCGENFEAPLPAPEASEAAFKRAIKRFAEEPDAKGSRREFFRLLLESELIVACSLQVTNGFFIPASPETGPWNIPRGSRVCFTRLEDRNGLKLVAAFTDWKATAKLGKGFSGMEMPANMALNAVVQGEFHGLVLDPNSDPAFFVGKEEAGLLLSGQLPPE